MYKVIIIRQQHYNSKNGENLIRMTRLVYVTCSNGRTVLLMELERNIKKKRNKKN